MRRRALHVLLGVWPIAVGAALYSLGGWWPTFGYVLGCAVIDWCSPETIDAVRGRE